MVLDAGEIAPLALARLCNIGVFSAHAVNSVLSELDRAARLWCGLRSRLLAIKRLTNPSPSDTS